MYMYMKIIVKCIKIDVSSYNISNLITIYMTLVLRFAIQMLEVLGI